MTSILKSECNKNGIILKETAKKLEEATSTSGCDSEMSEITSSIPHSLSLNTSDKVSVENVSLYIDTANDEKTTPTKNDETNEVEEVIDGFSIFCFLTEDDLNKFSIQHEKLEIFTESDNLKIKRLSKPKKSSKSVKNFKESNCTDDSIDVYEFPANSESSPSNKHSNFVLKKSMSKNHSLKNCRKPKFKFKSESLSEENSSNTSVTESQSIFNMDVRNESPRPTSNDDNNVVSTTTPDNLSFEITKFDLANNGEKIHSPNLMNPIKTASLRLYKLEDDITINNSHKLTSHGLLSNGTVSNSPTVSNSLTDDVKTLNQTQILRHDEKYQTKLLPNKFSVDLLTTSNGDGSLESDSNVCLSKPSNCDRTNFKTSPESDNLNVILPNLINSANSKSIEHTVASATAVESPVNTKMPCVGVKNVTSSNSCSSASLVERNLSSTSGSCIEGRIPSNASNLLLNDDDANHEKIFAEKFLALQKESEFSHSPITSWLHLQQSKSVYNNNMAANHQKSLSQANSFGITTKSPSGCYNTTKNSTAGNKLSSESAIDWPNAYLENAKMLNSLSRLNPNISSEFSRYQEHQELMRALRLKENSKISKPLVQLGIDAMYKLDPSTYKNNDSRYQNQNSSIHNYFMPNSQLPLDFKTSNVFKSRSDSSAARHNSLESMQSKESLSKPLSSSANFKAVDNVKRRGHWCDMHVKIAYFIYRSQRRLAMNKSQEINSQMPNLMYGQKLSTGVTSIPPAAYPSNILPHSNPYLDYRSQIKQQHDSNYMNYQPKSPTAFLNSPIRPINPYQAMFPQNLDVDIQTRKTFDEYHQTPEQKWLRLLNQFMTSNPLSFDRSNPEILTQFYLWYQQFAQNNNNNNNNSNNVMPHFNPPIPTPPVQSTNVDPNSLYLRKYMEQLAAYLASIKNENTPYVNPQLSERDLHLYMLKQQQQYQKAFMSKYQPPINKPTPMNYFNPLANTAVNPFYSKKLAEMKGAAAAAAVSESIFQQFPECGQSAAAAAAMLNHKYRLSHDQIRQVKQDQWTNNHSRNGFSKMTDPNAAASSAKRRKLNLESISSTDKDGSKTPRDLSNLSSVNNDCSISAASNINGNGVDLEFSKPRENSSQNIQTVVSDSKE